MTVHLLRHLISHIITELTDMNVGFGKTKLIKLLYLVDVENYRRRGATITGLKWRFYHYGPYAPEIEDALRALELDIPQDSVTIGTGHTATVFRPNQRLRPRLGAYVSSAAELRLVDRVIREWGEEDLNPLLNHVYFFTEPMRHAERGEILDFSAIPRQRPRMAAVHSPPMADDRVDEYKLRFQEARTGRKRRLLDPAPRFDGVYRAGLARMTAREAHGAPTGVVGVSDQVKERLRGDRDNEVSG